MCVVAAQASGAQRLAESLREAGAHAVVAESGGPGELLSTVAEQRPDVVVLDLDTPEAVALASEIVAPLQALEAKALVLVDPADHPRLLAAIATGADGIVARDGSAEGLVTSAAQLLDGTTLIDEAIRREVGSEVHRQRTREEAEPTIHPQRNRARGLLSRQPPL